MRENEETGCGKVAPSRGCSSSSSSSSSWGILARVCHWPSTTRPTSGPTTQGEDTPSRAPFSIIGTVATLMVVHDRCYVAAADDEV